MHRFELGAWNKRTDGRTNGSQHYLMPSPMGGHNKVVGNKYKAVIDYAV